MNEAGSVPVDPKGLVCAHCGARTFTTVGSEIDGKWYCFNCAQSGAYKKPAPLASKNVSDKELQQAIKAFSECIDGVDAQRLPDGLIDADRIALRAMRELHENRSRPDVFREGIQGDAGPVTRIQTGANDALRVVLRRLVNEVHGMLSLARHAMIETASLTNVRCLEFRENEARALLESLPQQSPDETPQSQGCETWQTADAHRVLFRPDIGCPYCEIERLTRERDEAKTDAQKAHTHAVAECQDNDRLRAALKRIEEMWPEGLEDAEQDMREIAREALSGESPFAPETADPDEYRIMNLTMFVRRLARLLRKHEPDIKPAAQALDYLERHGLRGSPLRSPDETEVFQGFKSIGFEPRGSQTALVVCFDSMEHAQEARSRITPWITGSAPKASGEPS